MARGAHALNARYRLAMTGTPLQNRAEELYSLIRFLKIGPYDVWERFWEDIGRPLRRLPPHLQAYSSAPQKIALRKVNGFLDRNMLRRDKQTMIDNKPIISLPEKIELVEPTEFDEDELKFYRELERHTQVKINQILASGNGNMKTLGIVMLVHLLRLRQACCHRNLLIDYDDVVEKEIKPDNKQQVDPYAALFAGDRFGYTGYYQEAQPMGADDFEMENLPPMTELRNIPVKRNKEYFSRLEHDYQPSAKVLETMELLKSIRQKDPVAKTIVFTFFTSFIDILEIAIRREGGFKQCRFDGTTNAAQRDAAVTGFMKGDTTVFLASIKSGNVGLNLNKATNVIILDPFWNPYVEAQAVDRAHRIGQKQTVTVYRLLIKGTVEDRILQLQERKKRLVEAVLNTQNGRDRKTASKLDRTEMLTLLGANTDEGRVRPRAW